MLISPQPNGATLANLSEEFTNEGSLEDQVKLAQTLAAE